MAMNSEGTASSLLLRVLPWGLCAALATYIAVTSRAPNPVPSPAKESITSAAERPHEKAAQFRRPKNAPFTEEEWLAAKAFLKEYSPNRFRRIEFLETAADNRR